MTPDPNRAPFGAVATVADFDRKDWLRALRTMNDAYILTLLDQAMDTAKAEAYQRGTADERARIVWWLRMGVAGPASVNTSYEYLTAVTDLADVIEQHPERFKDAPTSAVGGEA